MIESDTEKRFRSRKKGLLVARRELVTYLRRGGIEAAAHRPVAVFAGEMSVI